LLLTFPPCLLLWSVAPRALPSFPTRRSSDLSGRMLYRLDQCQTIRYSLAIYRDDQIAFLQARTLRRAIRYNLAQQRQWTCHLQPDRKSTRLNSSHVKISYAVFCLKKKKKNKE